MTDLKRIVAFAVCIALCGGFAGAADRGSHRFSVGITTQGFCSLKFSWEYAVEDDLYVGAFWQTSAVMAAQGDVDSGEAGALFRLDRSIGREAGFEAVVEAGLRYQNQNLGLVQSLFSRENFRPLWTLPGAGGDARIGADLGWDQTWVTHIRYSDYVRATWEDRYEGSSSAPESATLFLPSTKIRLGGSCTAFVARDAELSFAGGWLASPESLVGGFDGMMFGHFPFYSDMSLRLTE